MGELIQGLMLWLHRLTKHIRDLKQWRRQQQQRQKTIIGFKSETTALLMHHIF